MENETADSSFSAVTTVSPYEGGFSNPSHDAAEAFRGLMRAMARPGTIETVAGACAPDPVSPAAATALLTLCDHDTAVYLAPSHDRAEVREWITFHTNAPLTSADRADFALGNWEALQPIDRFKIGVSEYPDRAVTLIVEQADLRHEGAVLVGPGIRETAKLNLPEIDAFQRNAWRFPLGFDCVFTAGGQAAALPRSTRVLEDT